MITEKKVVRVGHTPDMDDAYMFYGIAEKAVEMYGLEFEHVIEDIQALNELAAGDDLDMTAVSAASYPELAHRYAIAAVGSSVGDNYGPLVVARQGGDLEALKHKRVAVPGLHTTACMLLQLAVRPVELVPMPFTEIPEAVLKGDVDAGVVIHEWQLTYTDSPLVSILDLGKWWFNAHELPIPLGLNIVNRRLSPLVQQQLATILRDSIAYALQHQEEAIRFAMQYARGTDLERSQKFVDMYVNEDTLTFSEDCRKSIELLFAEAVEAEIIPEIPPLDIVEPLPAS